MSCKNVRNVLDAKEISKLTKALFIKRDWNSNRRIRPSFFIIVYILSNQNDKTSVIYNFIIMNGINRMVENVLIEK